MAVTCAILVFRKEALEILCKNVLNSFYFQHILEFYLISELMIFELIEYINETAFRFTDNMVINI